MDKCIIFGCGNIGTAAYRKLIDIYEIVGWCDNNQLLWGKEKDGVMILSPEDMKSKCKKENISVIIAIKNHEGVIKQIHDMDISQVMIFQDGFLYLIDDAGCKIPKTTDMSIDNLNVTGSILFVQTEACIRTHKIALAVKKTGHKVYLAYLTSSPFQSNSEYANIYDDIFPINSMESFIEFVNKSDFKYVHSSNEPDFLTVLLTRTNKTIIHDCHDLSSAYKSMTPEEMELERLANVESDGVIYTTEGIRQEALRKFDIEREKTFVL